VPGPLTRIGSGAVSYASTFTALRFAASSEGTAERSRAKVVAALDRLEAELGGGDYLVGDSFSVADLTAAALFYPLVLPEGGPVPTDLPAPGGMERFRAPLKERPGYSWVQRTYELHRLPGVLVA
jgi:glutathione S-transferase